MEGADAGLRGALSLRDTVGGGAAAEAAVAAGSFKHRASGVAGRVVQGCQLLPAVDAWTAAVSTKGGGRAGHCSCSLSPSAGEEESANSSAGARTPELTSADGGVKAAVLQVPRVVQVKGAGEGEALGVMLGVGVTLGVLLGVAEPSVQVSVRMR